MNGLYSMEAAFSIVAVAAAFGQDSKDKMTDLLFQLEHYRGYHFSLSVYYSVKQGKKLRLTVYGNRSARPEVVITFPWEWETPWGYTGVIPHW